MFNLLSYLNKISLVAFFITTIAVGYQLYILKKERSDDQVPIIPDFKENSNSSPAANYTSLPSYLTKAETKKVNYSKLIFLVISLLTIIVVIVVVSLISKNYKTTDVKLNNSSEMSKNITPKPRIPTLTSMPQPIIIPTEEVPLLDASPAIEPTIEPTLEVVTIEPTELPKVEPTEIILASNPTEIPTEINPSDEQTAPSNISVLPETGSFGKGVIMIGAAVTAILLSFFF